MSSAVFPDPMQCDFCGESPCECNDYHTQGVQDAPHIHQVMACRNDSNPEQLDVVDVEERCVLASAFSMGEVRRLCQNKGWSLTTNRIADAMSLQEGE